MTEQEIIKAINTIADNHDNGTATDPETVTPELRAAITRLYTSAYNRGHDEGEKYGRESVTAEEKHELENLVNDALRAEYQSRYASMEKDYHRLKEQQEKHEEQLRRAIGERSRAVELLHNAISNLQDAEDELKQTYRSETDLTFSAFVSNH